MAQPNPASIFTEIVLLSKKSNNDWVGKITLTTAVAERTGCTELECRVAIDALGRMEFLENDGHSCVRNRRGLG